MERSWCLKKRESERVPLTWPRWGESRSFPMSHLLPQTLKGKYFDIISYKWSFRDADSELFLIFCLHFCWKDTLFYKQCWTPIPHSCWHKYYYFMFSASYLVTTHRFFKKSRNMCVHLYIYVLCVGCGGEENPSGDCWTGHWVHLVFSEYGWAKQMYPKHHVYNVTS